jgi:hypothetical protein
MEQHSKKKSTKAAPMKQQNPLAVASVWSSDQEGNILENDEENNQHQRQNTLSQFKCQPSITKQDHDKDSTPTKYDKIQSSFTRGSKVGKRSPILFQQGPTQDSEPMFTDTYFAEFLQKWDKKINNKFKNEEDTNSIYISV